jgi:hypothetical protein
VAQHPFPWTARLWDRTTRLAAVTRGISPPRAMASFIVTALALPLEGDYRILPQAGSPAAGSLPRPTYHVDDGPHPVRTPGLVRAGNMVSRRRALATVWGMVLHSYGRHRVEVWAAPVPGGHPGGVPSPGGVPGEG